MEENNVSMSSEVEASAMLAFESLKEELAAVPEDELVHINVDINTAVMSVLGSLGKMRGFRERVQSLPELDVEQFDKLETYARAAAWSNVLFTVASRPVESMPELAEEATRLRDLLYSDAMALAHRGLLRADDLRGISGQVPPPSTWREGISPALDRVVLKGLSVRAEDRYPDVQSMAAALAAALRQPESVAPPRWLGWLKRTVVVGLVGVCLLSALLLWLALRGEDVPALVVPPPLPAFNRP